MAVTQTLKRGGAPVSPRAPEAARNKRAGSIALGLARMTAIVVALIVGFALLWEGYKALGRATGDVWPFTGIPLPVSTSDSAMPHVWTILAALGEPASTASSQTLLAYYLDQTSVTLREAAYGLVAGSAVGVALAILLREMRFVMRGMLPWLVISQTIPLVALAPIIVVWVGSAGFPSWVAVAVIAAYLSFFPVTVNVLTGLNSIDPIHLEFMESIAASRWTILLRVRVPSAVPSFFTGLRLAATASVIGAIVGELSAGTGLGIGRAILTAAYYFSLAPENLFAAVLVASLAGVLFVQVITALEWLALRKRNNR